jgi:hypothetical protein
LAWQQAGYRKTDTPRPKKPEIPKAALAQIQQWATTGPREEALANLIWLAFFFLLRLGKYVWTNSNPHPFTLVDLTFKIATTVYPGDTIALELLGLASYVGLHFTEQKHGINNETIGLTRSRDTTCCPVLVMIRWVQHLQAHAMSPTTPLFIYLNQGITHHITNQMITDHLRHASVAVHQPLAYTVGALQNTGAQALLQAQVPLPMIKLIGRWRFNKVYRYLTAGSEKLMQPFSRAMLKNAYYRLVQD